MNRLIWKPLLAAVAAAALASRAAADDPAPAPPVPELTIGENLRPTESVPGATPADEALDAAVCLYHHGRAAEALVALRHAELVYPGSPAIPEWIAFLLKRSGRLEAAVESLHAALGLTGDAGAAAARLYGTLAEIYLKLARRARSAHRPDEARLLLTQAIDAKLRPARQAPRSHWSEGVIADPELGEAYLILAGVVADPGDKLRALRKAAGCYELAGGWSYPREEHTLGMALWRLHALDPGVVPLGEVIRPLRRAAGRNFDPQFAARARRDLARAEQAARVEASSANRRAAGEAPPPALVHDSTPTGVLRLGRSSRRVGYVDLAAVAAKLKQSHAWKARAAAIEGARAGKLTALARLRTARFLTGPEWAELLTLGLDPEPKRADRARIEALCKTSQDREAEYRKLRALRDPFPDQVARLEELTSLRDATTADFRSLEGLGRDDSSAIESLLPAELQRQVEAAVRQVAVRYGLDAVLDRQAMLAGGRDITREVLKRLPR